jgi:hypothetical protein
VRFLEISSSIYLLLDLLRCKGPIDATAALTETAATMTSDDHSAFVSGSRALLIDLAERSVIDAV